MDSLQLIENIKMMSNFFKLFNILYRFKYK